VKVEHGSQWRVINRHPYRWNARPLANLRCYWRDVRALFTRARWGWSVVDSWSTDDYIGAVLGEMLVHMAKYAHGAPAGYGVDHAAVPFTGAPSDTDFAKWEADLRTAGQALLTWQRFHYDYTSADRRQEEAVHNAAVDALHWVADNWGSLWD